MLPEVEMIRVSVFVLASAGIIVFSWPYLCNTRSHCFYRFFAFESILLLVLLNSEFWFIDPFGYGQIASWLILTLSLLFVIEGFRLLKVVGKPQNHIEDTTRLVTVGLYRYIRHPLYSSLLFLTIGAFLKDTSLVATPLFLIATISLIATARIEEIENLEKF